MSLVELLKSNSLLEDNIDEIYEQTTMEDVQKGSHWYSEALYFCKDQSEKYNKPIIQVAGITSSLSPRKEWNINKKLVINYLSNKHVGHTQVQVNKCDLICKTTNFLTIQGILKGPKTRNFFGNIMYPNDPYFLTIDSHMIRVITGLDTDKITPAQYRTIKTRFSNKANSLGHIPSVLQGILWITHKRIKPRSYKI